MTSFVVVLSHRGAYKGMVGPFAEESDAEDWALFNAPASKGWTWELEPLVSTESLAAWSAPARPALRVVS